MNSVAQSSMLEAPEYTSRSFCFVFVCWGFFFVCLFLSLITNSHISSREQQGANALDLFLVSHRSVFELALG